ncbi:hypothetical protein QFW80_04565 [Luteimonas sp. M1R5S18]|uniref:Uncharacterized protein n=1 Tax=Luteimonas rhizosphaericola TaxID=3042024 RepID=A0ABT6JIA7_9GAMM|nr:hypothetical protein [Luteimonas rhizosphaericola]MDH5829791.1 hypothetical protein [Luteimonas rhizosphaericola]
MTALERRQRMLEQLAGLDDAARLDMLRAVIDDMWRFGLALTDVGECMARNVDDITRARPGVDG